MKIKQIVSYMDENYDFIGLAEVSKDIWSRLMSIIVDNKYKNTFDQTFNIYPVINDNTRKNWHDINVVIYRNDYEYIEDVNRFKKFNFISLLFKNQSNYFWINTVHLISGISMLRTKARNKQLEDMLNIKPISQYENENENINKNYLNGDYKIDHSNCNKNKLTIKPDYLIWMGDFNTNLDQDESIYMLFKKRKIYIYDYSSNSTTTQKYSSLQTIVNTKEEKNVDCRIDGIYVMKRYDYKDINWDKIWIKFNDPNEGYYSKANTTVKSNNDYDVSEQNDSNIKFNYDTHSECIESENNIERDNKDYYIDLYNNNKENDAKEDDDNGYYIYMMCDKYEESECLCSDHKDVKIQIDLIK
eukprot:Mrub_04589.p1 GENE.Mrub_04589~~Mrub_04589.p1  ORF type:complete len:409 (+),score=74.81 Mrub_04589:156-1229(+)